MHIQLGPDLSGDGTRLPFHLFPVSGHQISLTAVCTQIGGAVEHTLRAGSQALPPPFSSENNGSTYYCVHRVES